MSAYGFALKSPRDFLGKAKREVHRLDSLSCDLLTSVEKISDAAINAALTLWHLNDWIARWPEAQPVIERIRLKNNSAKNAPLNILQEYTTRNAHIELCRRLANGAKHFEFRGTAETTLSSTTAVAIVGTMVYSERYAARVVLDDGMRIPAHAGH